MFIPHMPISRVSIYSSPCQSGTLTETFLQFAGKWLVCEGIWCLSWLRHAYSSGRLLATIWLRSIAALFLSSSPHAGFYSLDASETTPASRFGI